MDNNEKAIVKTLLYSDVFDYPLSKDEIWSYLISNKKINKKVFNSKVKKINSIVYRDDSYLYMKGKKKIVELRKKKLAESERKLLITKKIIKKIFIIPTVLFVGISGSLSLMSSDKKDDIDLFVITSRKTVWLTRFLLVIMLKFFGVYRARKDKNVSDKICLNMIISEDMMSFEKFQNLYTAHEIAQLMPIAQRKNIYSKFINSNKWIKKYMPNSLEFVNHRKIEKISYENKLLLFMIEILRIENIFRLLQKIKIRKNLTREIIDDDFIAFHPRDYKNIILDSYHRRLLRYGL